MRGAPLTVPEARVLLRADAALDLTFEGRLAAGTTFDDEERAAWGALVESATGRIAAFEGAKRAATAPVPPSTGAANPEPYPGGNAPDFQTLALEAVAAATARRREAIGSNREHCGDLAYRIADDIDWCPICGALRVNEARLWISARERTP